MCTWLDAAHRNTESSACWRWRFVSWTAVTVCAISCTNAAPSEPAGRDASVELPGSEKIAAIADWGVRFALPATWSVDREGSAYRAHGASGTEAEHASLVFEVASTETTDGVASDAVAIKTQLIKQLQAEGRDGKVLRTAAFERNGYSGLQLETSFVDTERRWRKDQLLINKQGYVLSISFSAAPEAFTRLHGIWKRAVDSLELTRSTPTP